MYTPKSIITGRNLNFISIGLGIINFILEGNISILALLIGGIAWFLIGFFTMQISQRKNWARITSLIIFLLGLIPFLFVMKDFIIHKSIPIVIITFAITLIQILALYLFFNKESNEWFKAQN